MASLQIRDMPDAAHRQLQLRARRHHRLDAQVRLKNLWRQLPRVEWPESPEVMVRADRER
jgi:plasmid stability protein